MSTDIRTPDRPARGLDPTPTTLLRPLLGEDTKFYT